MDQTVNIIQDAVYFRGIERLLISLGGLFAIVLGGLLYKWGILDKTDVKIDGGAFSPGVVLRNASPGVIFCLFGVLIFWYGLSRQVVWEQDTKAVTDMVKAINSGEPKSSSAAPSPMGSASAKSSGVPKSSSAAPNPGEVGQHDVQSESHVKLVFSAKEKASLEGFLQKVKEYKVPPDKEQYDVLRNEAQDQLNLMHKQQGKP